MRAHSRIVRFRRWVRACEKYRVFLSLASFLFCNEKKNMVWLQNKIPLSFFMSFDDSFTDKISNAPKQDTHEWGDTFTQLQALKRTFTGGKEDKFPEDLDLRTRIIGRFLPRGLDTQENSTQETKRASKSSLPEKPALPPIKLYSLEELQREIIKQEWSENIWCFCS